MKDDHRATAFVTGGSGFVGRALIPALVRRGHLVKALARSERAAAAVRALGAEPAAGDLDTELPAEALAGCELVFHAAASLDPFPKLADAWRTNVDGTQRVLDAARAAGVRRLVHVSTEAVLLGGPPIRQADESWPLPSKPLGVYATTKGEAERRVLAANGGELATVIARPRLIWGKGDTTLLPKMIEAVQRGDFAWIGGGQHLTSTCHIDNCIEGLLCCAERGAPGEAYFFTDGEPIAFRAFVERLLETQGVRAPERSVPHWLAHAFSVVSDAAYRWLRLRGAPALPHYAFHLLAGDECTVSDAKARRELAYLGKVTREAGWRAMQEAAAGPS